MKCLSCGVEKDAEVNEVYPYEEDGLIHEPIPPFFEIDCQPLEDVAEVDSRWRKVRVCHECFHRLKPDMWIGSRCWKALDPVTPFADLPLLEEK